MFFMALCSLTGYAQFPEGFEGSWPPTGWTVLNVAGPVQTWTQANGTAAQPAHTGSHAAYLERENMDAGTFAEDWLITPAVTIPTNGQLRFWSRFIQNNDQGSTMKIMVGTDTNDLTTWTPIEEWTELELNTVQMQYTEIVVPIPAIYTNTSVRIAFVMLNDQGDRWLVDDVNIVEQCFDPTNITVTETGVNSADFTWSGTAASWEVEVLESELQPTGTGVEFTGPGAYQATTLEPGTEYKIYVKAICSTGTESNWVGPIVFTTVGYGETCEAPIEIAALPYATTDNTENYGNNYDGSTGTGCGTSNFEQYLFGNDVVYEYTPDFTGTIEINLNNTGNYAGVFVYDSCENIGESCIAGAITGWQNTSTSIPELAVTSGTTYYIVLSNSVFQTNPYTLIIQRVTCDPPVGLPPSNVQDTSVDLSWTNPTEADSWQIVIQAPGAGIPSGAGTTVTTNTNYQAGPLLPSTPYEYYVRADCGDGLFSQWAGPYLFNTQVCEPEFQCLYTFNMTDDFNDGWTGNTISVIQSGVTIATITLEDGEEGSITVPFCNGIPFELYWNEGGQFPTDIGLTVKNNYGQTFYTLESGQDLRGLTLYEGDVDCSTPLCLPPEDLTATNITQTTADLGWAGEATGSWQYYLVEAGAPAPTADTEGVVTTTNPVTDTTLTEATEYEYYVRLECVDGYSEWAGPYEFSSSICPVAEKCDYTFIMLSNWWSGWQDANMVISQNGVKVATIGDTFTEGQSQEVTVALCTDIPFEITWTDAGTAPLQVGLSVVNSFDQTLYTMEFDTESPGDVIYTGDADCINPACLPPTGLVFNSSTMTSINVGWEGPETGNWEYFLVPAGDPAPADTAAGTLTTTNPVEIPAPDPATNYEVYVRILCDGENPSSPWAGPLTVNTAVCAEEDQCTFFFEMTSANGWGWENNTMTVYQSGVPIATIGDEFTWGDSMTVEIPLCPDVPTEIRWNEEGWSPDDKGLNVYTPYMEDFFILEPGQGEQGTTVYTGTTSCDAPPCPRPQDLVANDVTLTTASLEWAEMGSATQWEIIILPYGSDEPLPTDTGIVTDEMPYPAGPLLPGTAYEFYVRALCGGEAGNSNWAGPQSFITAVPNDDCADAVSLTVNTTADCNISLGGTLSGATFSGLVPSCGFGEPVADVWYSFEATNATQAIAISNVQNMFPGFVVYEGDGCGNLTEVSCSTGTVGSISGLTPGETYYVLVYTTSFNDENAPSTFDICVSTPTSITVDNTTHTIPELVTEVLINSLCANISNVTWSTGGDSNNLTTGIAMFTKGNSQFGIDEGVVLVTGDAMLSAGPNLAQQSDGGWDGDEDLFDFVEESGVDPGLFNYNDATVLEFDFVPQTTHMKFPFFFASEEYGDFQCSYSDAFAFFLTGPDGNTINLAVIPETNIPVAVTTIRDEAYNTPFNTCDSENPELFDAFYGTEETVEPGIPAISAPINYDGVTKTLIAETDVVQGATYHIKLVIADRNDSSLNSAVFIGPFDIGNPDLGEDLTVGDETAICSDQTVTLNSSLDPEEYSFIWYRDDEEIEGETGPTLVVTQEGTYSVVAHYFDSTCETTDSVVVEFYDPIEVIIADPQDLTECESTGYDEFNLGDNTAVVLEGVANPGNYEITYHLTEADALSGDNDLDLTYTNVTQFQQTIYVRALNTVTGCVGFKPFDLIVQTIPPQFTVSEDVTICNGSTATIAVIPGNFEESEATYTWTLNGTTVLPDTTASIQVTLDGEYEVVVDRTGCIGTATINVEVLVPPALDDLSDVTACGEFVLPVLSANNAYFNAQGVALFAGESVTSTQVITVIASTDTTPACTQQDTFTVTIEATPVVTTPGDQNVCDGYVLPALTVGNYFTLTNGGGTQLVAGETVATTQEIFVYAVTPFGCSDEESFTVTVLPRPVPDAPADVTSCDSFTLTPLTVGNYYTAVGGTGTQLNAGDIIYNDQTVYVYASNGACFVENTFDIDIVPVPMLSIDLPITQECDQMDFILTAVFALEEDVYTPDNVTYTWTNLTTGASAGTGASVIITEPGNYEVRVTPVDATTCFAEATIQIDDTSCAIQRGISPGGSDGLNDTFDLSNLEVRKLSIFNRYGQEVYSFNGAYTDQWGGQGSNGDELPTGTYFYMFERTNGEAKTGWIYINRNNN